MPSRGRRSIPKPPRWFVMCHSSPHDRPGMSPFAFNAKSSPRHVVLRHAACSVQPLFRRVDRAYDVIPTDTMATAASTATAPVPWAMRLRALGLIDTETGGLLSKDPSESAFARPPRGDFQAGSDFLAVFRGDPARPRRFARGRARCETATESTASL